MGKGISDIQRATSSYTEVACENETSEMSSNRTILNIYQSTLDNYKEGKRGLLVQAAMFGAAVLVVC